MIIKTLPIKDICTDAGTQSRVSLDESVVQEYYEYLTSHEEDLPPVTVFFDGLEYFLADGFHRIMAYQRDGREFIDANLKGGTLRDAVKFSLGANSTHGLKRSYADKRKSVATALDDPEWSQLNAREIARMCDVSHTLVNEIIAERNGTPKKAKPVKLKNVVEAPLEEQPTKDGLPPAKVETFPENDMVQEVLAENEQLKDRLAVAAMDATEEEKELAQETIEELRTTVKNLNLELDAVKKSRDQFQRECAELKKQVKMYQNQLKKAA
jgi:FtsZ-binding cell division protein ZapB